jgi:hypothetical protein
MCTGTPGKVLYPNCRWMHGDIIINHDDIKFYALFPHLFRSLEWWESRNPNDMPEYVRLKSKVFKVEKYCISGNEFITDGKKIIKSLANTLPATEQEYQEYMKLK